MKQKNLNLTLDDLEALECFLIKYPTWWYKIGVCDVSWDFDCAPQGHSPEIEYVENGTWEDNCFSYDSKESLLDAIEKVVDEIEACTP